MEVVDLPEPAGDGVVIEVAAAGICFPDVLLTRGRYQVTPDLPFVPEGSEPPFRLVTRGAQQADADEIAANPRAASVRLRAAERVHPSPPSRGVAA